MAHLLGAESLHLEYPTKVVFDAVTVGLSEGDRIGIVGRNGDGKSSLLGMLAGIRTPDSGRVTVRGGVTVGVLDQADTLDDDEQRRLEQWSGAGIEAPVGLATQLLAAAVRTVPDAAAVIDADRSLTYRELDEWSTRLARILIEAGIGPERAVGCQRIDVGGRVAGPRHQQRVRRLPGRHGVRGGHRHQDIELARDRDAVIGRESRVGRRGGR